MHTLMQDLRYALRTAERSAALTLVIVASLGIGIGANTAIFSVVNALLLKPLPYPDPDRLVVLWLRSPGINIPQDWPSRSVHRHSDGEPLLRGDLHFSGAERDAAGARSTGACRGAPHFVQPVSSTGGEAALWPPAPR